MILRIAQPCHLAISSLDGNSEAIVNYDEGYLIHNCTFSKVDPGQLPDIIFADEDNELTGYRAIGVPSDWYEIVGEPMKIRFKDALEYDDEEYFDTAPGLRIKWRYEAGEEVICVVFGYQTGDESIDIEMADGVVFNQVNSEIIELIESIPAENA